MSATEYDVVVLGGGPGGYVAAIRAAQLGLKTCVVDEQPLGGICVNWGCIPSKALLKTAELYQNIQHIAPEMGIHAKVDGFDWTRVIKRSREVSEKNSSGVEFLVRKSKIHRPNGRFRIVGDHEIEVHERNKPDKVIDRIRGKHMIIATGSTNRTLPGVTIDRKRIITYMEAMSLEKQPKALIIVGAGAIGCEFAYFYQALGTQVTLIEVQPRILPLEDVESSKVVETSFRKSGMNVLTNSRVSSITATDKGVAVQLEGGDKPLAADHCLVAIGFAANVEGWGFDKTGVALERGFIKVDPFHRTNVPGYYAIGDVVGAPQLAHTASHEGVICVDAIAGKHPHPMDYSNNPACTYCQPQVASVGYSEEKCKELGIEYKVGKFPFSASGKARAIGHTEGHVKLLFDRKYGQLIGAHIVGSEATEMIAELALAKSLECTAETIYQTVHAHPTLTEAVMEAALAADDRVIHM
ncbi:MAG: dihydrolipoyl dehydrogenase [bacterium]|nr:dihydrolipoyl dehydrogenase [bacterium]